MLSLSILQNERLRTIISRNQKKIPKIKTEYSQVKIQFKFFFRKKLQPKAFSTCNMQYKFNFKRVIKITYQNSKSYMFTGVMELLKQFIELFIHIEREFSVNSLYVPLVKRNNKSLELYTA